MSKRASDEERILNYFRLTPLPTAQAILNVVKGEMRTREASENAAGVPVTQIRRKKRTANKAKDKVLDTSQLSITEASA